MSPAALRLGLISFSHNEGHELTLFLREQLECPPYGSHISFSVRKQALWACLFLAEQLECPLLCHEAQLLEAADSLHASRMLLAAHNAARLCLHQVLASQTTGCAQSSSVIHLCLCAALRDLACGCHSILLGEIKFSPLTVDIGHGFSGYTKIMAALANIFRGDSAVLHFHVLQAPSATRFGDGPARHVTPAGAHVGAERHHRRHPYNDRDAQQTP